MIIKTDDKHYRDIAKAIGRKKKKNSSYSPAQMATEINSIVTLEEGTQESNLNSSNGDYLLEGNIAFGQNGEKIVGIMTNNSKVNPPILNAGSSYTIPIGYHNGQGKIQAKDLASQTQPKLGTNPADNIDLVEGTSAWINGQLVEGVIKNGDNIKFLGQPLYVLNKDLFNNFLLDYYQIFTNLGDYPYPCFLLFTGYQRDRSKVYANFNNIIAAEIPEVHLGVNYINIYIFADTPNTPIIFPIDSSLLFSLQDIACPIIFKFLEKSAINTSNVKNMTRMFYNYQPESDLDLTAFNTNNVETMEEMFAKCLISSLDLSSFTITENTIITNMFKDSSIKIVLCKNQQQIDLLKNKGNPPSTIQFKIKEKGV